VLDSPGGDGNLRLTRVDDFQLAVVGEADGIRPVGFPPVVNIHRSLMEFLGDDLSKPGTCGNPEPELAFAVREWISAIVDMQCRELDK
jgi:hypothetical protein